MSDTPLSTDATGTEAGGRAQAKKGRGCTSPLLVLSLLAVAYALSGVFPAGTATGEIRSTGRPHGDFVVRTAQCYSRGKAWSSDVSVIAKLERPWSGGVGFRGGLLLEKDDAGRWRVVAENPNGCHGFDCPQRTVDPRHCKVFDVVSEASGWVWRRRGHARLDCSFPGGGTLKADLKFSGCAHVWSSDAEP